MIVEKSEGVKGSGIMSGGLAPRRSWVFSSFIPLSGIGFGLCLYCQVCAAKYLR